MATAAEKARQDRIIHAQLCDATKRYTEMIAVVDGMVTALQKNQDLSEEERKLVSIAYKNEVGPRRRSWQLLEKLLLRSKKLTDKDRQNIINYRRTIAREIQVLCNQLIKMLDTKLIPRVSEPESDIFYHKLKGDYCRYLVEVEEDSVKVGEYISTIDSSYKGATDYCDKSLPSTHPLCLGLAMNYSVFIFEMQNDTVQARDHAKKYYDAALDELDTVDEVHGDRYNECVRLLKLLHANIKSWHTKDTLIGASSTGPASTQNTLKNF